MDLTCGGTRRRAAKGLAVVAALALTAPLTGTVGQGEFGGATGPDLQLVLRIDSAAMGSVLDRVHSLGGTVERRLDGIEAAVVRLPVAAAGALRSTAGVLGMSENAPVKLQGQTGGYDAGTDPNSMLNVAYATKVNLLWDGVTTGSPVTGAGIDVALIDSGVTPVEGLSGPGKVLNGPDLSFESQNGSTRYLDTFGHGTFMAGIIAGKDADEGTSAYRGMAPDSRVISLKVADARGNTDVSQVIAAIDWVVQHRADPGMNIRVLNLSFGTPSLQAYTLDPLSYAAETAWRKGIVVVVSVGNDGTGTGKLLNPAQDPYVLAVGADDTKGTRTVTDDVIPAFSTRGDGVRNPDLVAPGVSLQGLRVPGSYADVTYGSTAAFDGRFFRGSGTSQAAAVVSGAAALLLQHRPGLTPDQVKALLRAGAKGLPAADQQAQGAGVINVDLAAKTAPTATRQSFPTSTGTGTLDGARGSAKLVKDGVVLSGEKDIMGNAYVTGTRALQEATGTSWVGGLWNGSSWAGSSWAGSSWAGSSWAGGVWASALWR